jgi:ketosteroid isomerase-like protein
MAFVVHVTLRGVTKEQYDAVRAQAGWLEQPPGGGLSHVTWWEGDDCYNVDAWESEAAFNAFGEQRLGPAMAAVGIGVQPEVTMHPAHEVLTPRSTIVAPTATPSLTAIDSVSLIRGGYEAFARGDIPAVLGLFAPTMQWYSPDSIPNGGTYTGPAEVGGFFATLPEMYTDLSVQPETFVDRGDTVAVVGRHSGRTAAGNDFELPFVHVWTVSKGKATSFTEHLDTTKLNALLGVPSPRSAGQPVRA